MKRGLLLAILILSLAISLTCWLFVQIEYGNLEAFFRDLERKLYSSQEVLITAKVRRFRYEKLPAIQKAIREQRLDGWLFYDYHGSDTLTRDILGIANTHAPSRRWFYYIPANGLPQKLVHRVEYSILDGLPGNTRLYLSWEGIQSELSLVLAGVHQVAMQYSPDNRIPIISRVDAGTIEMIRSLGIKVVSSAELLQMVEAPWTEAQLQQHRRAATMLYERVQLSFAEVRAAIESNEQMTEGRLLRFIEQQCERAGLKDFSPPRVAFGANSANPYYSVPANDGSVIKPGGVLVLELRGHVDEPDAVYAAITWTGYTDRQIPEDVERAFKVAAGARDASIQALRNAASNRQRIEGWEVDATARNFIASQGFGDCLRHGTGYSLGQNLVGLGANLDGLESQDTRPIIGSTAFSVSPGIYTPQWGIRTEVNVFIGKDGPEITTLPVQNSVTPLLR